MVDNGIFRLLFVFWCLSGLTSFAQQDTNYYRITFTDKSNTPFTIQQPEDFLSEKAIARRDSQGIAIIEQDLPVDPNYMAQVLSFASVEYATHSNWFNQLVVVSDDTNDINTIELLPFVANSEQFKMPLGKSKQGQDKLALVTPKRSILVNPHYPYGITYSQNHIHNLDFMHDLSFNGQGIDIAVIDAGFQNVNSLNGLEHLFGSGQILSTYDFVDRETSVAEDHSHGSAVLSVMAGYIAGEFYGTAVGANYHLLRSEDANAEYIIEEDYWVRAAEYADSAGCSIINTSLGYTTFDDSTQNHTYGDLDGNTTLIARASDIASSKGILCVTSAGNNGQNSWGYIGSPADADSALTVGAIDRYNQLAPFSSYGPSADGEIKPNVVSVGWLTQLIAPWDNEIIQANGTSFSAPMVAGMAACLWQALPSLTNMELKSLLEENATQSSDPDTLRGYGIPLIFDAYHTITGIVHQSPANLEIQGIFPNPATSLEALSLRIASDTDQETSLLLVDVVGRIVELNTIALSEGINMVTLTTGAALPAGVYSVVVQTTDQMDQVRLVVH
jgi:hypothetical protein